MSRPRLVVAMLVAFMSAPTARARPETSPEIRQEVRTMLRDIDPGFLRKNWELAQQGTLEIRLRLLARDDLDEVDRAYAGVVKFANQWILERVSRKVARRHRRGMVEASRTLLEVVAQDETRDPIQFLLERTLARGADLSGEAQRFFYWDIRECLREIEKAGLVPEDVTAERELLEKAYYQWSDTTAASFEIYYRKLLEYVIENHGEAPASSPRQKSRLKKFAEFFGGD